MCEECMVQIVRRNNARWEFENAICLDKQVDLDDQRAPGEPIPLIRMLEPFIVLAVGLMLAVLMQITEIIPRDNTCRMLFSTKSQSLHM